MVRPPLTDANDYRLIRDELIPELERTLTQLKSEEGRREVGDMLAIWRAVIDGYEATHPEDR